VRRLEVARTVEAVEALRPAWSALQGPHYSSDIDQFLTFVRHSPRDVSPHVVLVERDGEPAGLVVARLENFPLPARLGYVRFAPQVRSATVVYGGFLGADDENGAQMLLDALSESLRSERVDLVRLRMLTVDSPVHAAATGRAPALRRRRFFPRLPHWTARVTGSLDEFLAGRSRRRRDQIRRHVKDFEARHAGELELRYFRRPDELEELFALSERVYSASYQSSLGVGFHTDPLNRRLVELALEQGWFLGAVLSLGGEPIAFKHGNVYRGTYAGVGHAFHPAHSADRPGNYLLVKVIETLCADPDVHTLDFGFGGGQYKQSFGDEYRLEEDVGVFEWTPRAVGVHVSQTAILSAGAAAQSVLRRTGGVQTLRRRWRARLGSSGTDR